MFSVSVNRVRGKTNRENIGRKAEKSSVCVEKKSARKSENLIRKEERKERNNEGLRSEREDKG